MTNEKAIERIKAFRDYLCSGNPIWDADECREAFDIALAAMEQQWIPVSERLPKPIAPSQRREWFITSNQYGGVTLTCYEFEASPFKEGWQTDMTILAWMPLPEPWRGEDDG